MAAKRRKPDSSASPAPQPSAPMPHSVVPRPASAPALHSDAPVYEVRATPPRIFDASDDLLSRARMQWQFGEWPSLLHLDLLAIEHHPARAELALLSGCAALQMGQPDTARRYLTAAEAWDCHPALMARLLLAGVANSLARYHALKGNSETSETYFLEAASALGGDPRLAARARQQQELPQLNRHTQHLEIPLTSTHSRPSEAPALRSVTGPAPKSPHLHAETGANLSAERPPTYIAFDVGANTGNLSIALAKSGEFKVYAFEPNIELFTVLNTYSSSLPLTCYCVAVAENASFTEFNISRQGNYGTSSLLEFRDDLKRAWPNRTDLKHEKTATVEVIRLDEFLKTHQIATVDYIHIDCQGKDIEVLLGLGTRLESVVCGVLETARTHSTKLYKNQAYTLLETVCFLAENGFAIFSILPNDHNGNPNNRPNPYLLDEANEVNLFFYNKKHPERFSQVRDSLARANLLPTGFQLP
jgi:FkbM family methyltransferase